MTLIKQKRIKDQKLVKWICWVEAIHNECESLKIKSYFYREYLQIVKNNPVIGSPQDFHMWVTRNYYESALMSIRRLTDDHRGTISLINLLTEIKNEPDHISKEWYLSSCNNDETKTDNIPTTRDFMEDYFDNTFTYNKNGLSTNKISSDILFIKSAESKLSIFIDNCLAHKNEGYKGRAKIKTKDIEDTIMQVEKITIKYLDLFGKGNFVTLEPTYQYDWKIIFTKPWIKL